MIDKEHLLLAKSIEWIGDHPSATNHDVPGELLEFWTSDKRDADGLPCDSILEVFLTGYLDALQRRNRAANMPRADEVLAVYLRWQEKLLLAKLHRSTEFSVTPAPLFEFPQDEEYRIKRRPLN